ncbi:hypothetical protein PUN28_004430 [Cardiocondyla obscurior]
MAHAVQNFVEKIVDGLVESVNDTPIDKLYEDSEYDRFLEEHRPPLIAALIRLAACLRMSLTNKPPKDPPAMAHAALREIVERAVEEARKLPGLNETTDAQHPREGRADNSYEDLLATAILNKVIERYQRERVDGNSNVVHDTDPPKAKYTANESEHVPGEDVASYAFDLACNDDHGASIRQNEDLRKPMSFTMEERIEEVTTITSDEDQLGDSGALEFGCTRRVPFPEYGIDIVDHPQELPSPSSSDSSDLNRTEYPPVKTKRHAAGRTMDIISPIESWEDNWLFQRKRTSRSQPDAVAMLVPSSNAYYKALIGDRDAEDTSDLSECSSTKSDEEIEKELMEAINNVIPRTPRTSECDATNDRAESNRKGTLIRVHSGKDDTDSENFREITETEDNVPNSERFEEEKSHERPPKSTKITEGKINKNKDEKGYQNESSFAAMVRKEKGKAKEKSNNTVERGERTIATAVESSKQKEVKMQTEKSGERSVRGENVADENEEQRESEYTEHYDTAIQRHLDSLTRVEVCSAESEAADEARKITDEQLKKSENTIEELKSKRSNAEVQLPYATIDEKHVLMSENDPLSAPPRPGTIAEREHKKWENAPPIENNPYSEESIRKRCLERQYSKNSDISGAHYELTKLNEANLETLLIRERADIKRFGRDYYINQSKAASGERPERATSAMSSISSRPSSSLSQQSNCAGDEHERQVSLDKLEQFEAASLRDSLPRRCCRDPRASPHFAINPLLHLETVSDRLTRRVNDDDDELAESFVRNDARTMYHQERKDTREVRRDDRGPENFAESDTEAVYEREEVKYLPRYLDANVDPPNSALADWNQPWNEREGSVDRENEEPIVPRYDCRAGPPRYQDDRDPGDHDSGMCSIGSRDSENSERDRWRQLYQVTENDRPGGTEQILVGGRKFWTTNGYKYHTFGGIKIGLKNPEELDDDLEDEPISPENLLEDRSLEFAKLKFQTFGGIKKGRRVNSRRIPNYRRIRLKPILLEDGHAFRGPKNGRDSVETESSMNFELHSDLNSSSCDLPANLDYSASVEGFASFEHSTSSTFEESDLQDEENDAVNDRVYAQIGRKRNRTSAPRTSSMIKRKNLLRKKNISSSSPWPLPSENDEWQDEIDCASDEIIMNKFLKDVSKRRKVFIDDVAARRTRSRKHREVLEGLNKLGKSISRNTERNLETLKESRREERDDEERYKKLYVRSLSDVTIW